MTDEPSDLLVDTTAESCGGNEGEVNEGVCDSEGYQGAERPHRSSLTPKEADNYHFAGY